MNIIIVSIFGLFLIIFLWIGVLASRLSTHTDADYLLGNQSFGKYFIGLSASATANSGWIMIGAVVVGILTLTATIHLSTTVFALVLLSY